MQCKKPISFLSREPCDANFRIGLQKHVIPAALYSPMHGPGRLEIHWCTIAQSSFGDKKENNIKSVSQSLSMEQLLITSLRLTSLCSVFESELLMLFPFNVVVGRDLISICQSVYLLVEQFILFYKTTINMCVE